MINDILVWFKEHYLLIIFAVVVFTWIRIMYYEITGKDEDNYIKHDEDFYVDNYRDLNK